MTSRSPNTLPAPLATAFATNVAPSEDLPAPLFSGPTSKALGRTIKLSLVISATRCLLTYVLIPILSPLIQPTLGENPRVAIPLSVAALCFDVRAVRGVWQFGHKWRWKITAVYSVLMAGIVALLAQDFWRLAR
jgi:hypothetical protein